jgi:hypothetical protein
MLSSLLKPMMIDRETIEIGASDREIVTSLRIKESGFKIWSAMSKLKALRNRGSKC